MHPKAIYDKLFACFGPQNWWPADSAFEVIVGAILTQNTSWANVEKAISNLKKHKLLSARRLKAASHKELSKVIMPSGCYNIKAKRLKEFLRLFFNHYRGSIKRMSGQKTASLRKYLLGVKGIGEETADSILLYALNRPVFVVDAYTRRLLLRHKLINEGASYTEVQKFFTAKLKKSAKLFNEYHALLVKSGKEFCLKSKPRCRICPIKSRK